MQMDMSCIKGCVQHLTLHTSCLFLEAPHLDDLGGTDPGGAPKISEAARSIRAQDALNTIAEVR